MKRKAEGDMPYESAMPKRARADKSMYRSKSKYPRRSSVGDSFSKRVLAIVNSAQETKEQSTGSALLQYNSGISVSGDVNRVLPSIDQGVDDGQRIGSDITAVSLNIKGHVILTYIPGATTASNARICARMMVVTPRRYMHTTDAIANATSWLPVLLKKGNTENSFTGTIENLYQPINEDQVIVHYDKLMWLTTPLVNNYTLVGENSVDLTRSSMKFFDIDIPVKNKKLRFDEVSDYTYGFGPVLIIGYAHADGSSSDVLETQVAMQYFSTLKYKDA